MERRERNGATGTFVGRRDDHKFIVASMGQPAGRLGGMVFLHAGSV
jgi:hypothetical protein